MPAFYGFYFLMNQLGFAELPDPGIGESIFLAVMGIFPYIIPVAVLGALSGVAGGETFPRLTRKRVGSLVGAFLGALIGVVITTILVLSRLDWVPVA